MRFSVSARAVGVDRKHSIESSMTISAWEKVLSTADPRTVVVFSGIQEIRGR